MVFIFEEDGCSYQAIRKHAGDFAELQQKNALKWAQQLSERVKPIEERAASLPNRLRSCLHEGSLAIVTGAGVSMSCGLPSWYTLVNEAAQKILQRNGLIETEIQSMLASVSFADDLLSFSQALTALSSEGDLASVVASHLYAQNPKPSTLVESLVSVIKRSFELNSCNNRPTLALTFNYDILLEEALAHAGLYVESVDRNVQIEDLDTDVVHVLHAHGILRRKDSTGESIVFTEQSYGDAYLRTGSADPLSSLLDAKLMPLFVGFSFRDHFVRQILHGYSIKRDGPVAIGILAKNDLFKVGKLHVASPYELGFSPNDEVGWQKTGKSPMSVRNQTFPRIPEHLARWILYSVGVEWWSVNDRDALPKELAELSGLR